LNLMGSFYLTWTTLVERQCPWAFSSRNKIVKGPYSNISETNNNNNKLLECVML